MVAVVFLGISLYYSEDVFASIALFAFGILFFTFIEYAVHAWLFHKSHFAKVFIEGHANHHKNPFSYDAMPFFLPVLIFYGFVLLLSIVIPQSDAFAILAGMSFGYFSYGIMHHVMHRREFKSPYWKYMQEFHFIHHKKPLLNNGITTDIWDRIFDTYYNWDEKDLKGIEKLKRIK
jgi:sterol desaturase/sphingolipid hydroxylase (fatty acid hydroxylase superfamily)